MQRRMMNTFLASTMVVTGAAHIANAAVLTVGASGDYSSIADAWAAAGASDTIQFVDSAAYSSGTLFFSGKAGLTIESAPGQRATINFTGTDLGFYLNANNATFRNLNLTTNSGIGSIVTAESSPSGAGATINNVSFTRTTETPDYGLAGLVQSAEGMEITYSTFRGSGSSPIKLGVGLSWSIGTTVTVDHSSFDNFMIPINQGASTGTTDLTITNSAFGGWHGAGWAGGISLGDSGSTLQENFNAAYGPSVFIYNPAGAIVTSGGDSFTVDSYSKIFAGSTGLGEWQVHPDLYYAASDGTTIGAWQIPEPGSLSLLGLAGFAVLNRRRRA